MSKELELKVQNIYKAFQEGRISDIASHLATDVQWEHNYHNHDIPWIKERRGIADTMEFFNVLSKELKITEFQPLSFLSNDTQVAGVVQLMGEVQMTKRVVKDYEIHLFTFDQSGKVSQFRHFVDTHEQWKALQP